MRDKQKQLDRRNNTEAGKIERALFPLRTGGLVEWESIHELNEALKKLRGPIIEAVEVERYTIG